MITTHHNGMRVGILLAASLAALTGCAGPASSSGTPTPDPAATAVTISDAWVKAADSGMTGGFGTLRNASDQTVTVVSATSDVAATVELHETAMGDGGSMVMRPKEGGFVIPAGGELVLEPGGNHIMLMNLSAPLLPGDDVAMSLTFSDGSTYRYTAPVKDFAGANENYVGGATATPEMDEMGH